MNSMSKESEHHNIEKIQDILSKFGVKNIESPGDFFKFCISALAKKNHDDLFDSLIYPGSLIICLRDTQRRGIFYYACAVSDIRHTILEKFLKNGVDINEEDSKHNTAFSSTFTRENRERHKYMKINMNERKECPCPEFFRNTKFLMNNGANMNVPYGSGLTYVEFFLGLNDFDDLDVIFNLFNAEIPVNVENRFLYAIKFLLKQQSVYEFSHQSCLNLLWLSIQRKDVESFKYVLSNTKINVNGNMRCTNNKILCIATYDGEPEFIKILIDEGADPNLPNEIGLIPISYAIYCEKIENLQCLLDSGAPFNNTRKIVGHSIYATPLCEAVCKQSIKMVEMLLKKGADVNKLLNHQSPLMFACGYSECVPKIFPRNYYKSNSYNPMIVKLLLDYGANIEAKNSEGQTALCYACRVANLEIVEILLSRGAKIERRNSIMLKDVVLGGRPAIFKIMLKEGLSFNSRCEEYGSILEFIISPDRPAIYRSGSKLVLAHVAKMIASKKYVNIANREALKNESIKKRYEVYAEELSRMKERNISQKLNFSFLDILTKDIDYLGSALRQEDLRLVLNEGKYQEEFHNYSEDLKDRIQEAEHRLQLVELASPLFQKQINKQISLDIVLQIFKNLTIKDLDLFVSLFS